MLKKKLVVVGGGTAGWLAALWVKKTLINYDITLIQSKEVGIIGVGESTTPNFVRALEYLDIKPTDLISATKGSIKNGISFENWNGDGKKYFHSFGDAVTEFSVPPIFKNDSSFHYHKLVVAKGLNLDEYMYQNRLAYSNKIDVNRTSYSLQFDANLVGKYLNEIAVSRGVKEVEGTVRNFIQDEQGFVRKICLDDGREIEADFVFDCSGFSRLIIGKLYNQKWISYSKYLPMKKGIPFWLESEEIIQPYTSCIALKNGWSWHIPLQNRIGSGYVFDSDYITDEEALLEAEQHYKRKLEPRKFIPFEAGSYENYWVKNCIAFGLSSSFIEPLESTSLFATIAQLCILLSFYDDLENPRESSIKMYNHMCTRGFEEISDFVYLHYVTKRNDSKFWREFKDKNPVPPTLQEKLELLKECNLRPENIDDKFAAAFFNASSFLQVAAGLGIPEKLPKIENLDMVYPSIEQYKNAIEHLLLHEAHNHRYFLENANIRT